MAGRVRGPNAMGPTRVPRSERSKDRRANCEDTSSAASPTDLFLAARPFFSSTFTIAGVAGGVVRIFSLSEFANMDYL